jgi:hypothetical protein
MASADSASPGGPEFPATHMDCVFHQLKLKHYQHVAKSLYDLQSAPQLAGMK